MLLGPGYASSPALAQLFADQMHASELLQLALDHMREHLQVADGRRVELGKGKMDARLAMPRCATPLVFEAQQQNQRGDRLLVKTSCEDQKRWAVYVPLQYREFAQAVVSTRPIARGKTIEREDIALAEVAVQKTGGNYLPAIDQALGMLATRDVSAGSALQLAALKAPMLVKRGDQVVILAKAGSVQVRMNGTALAAGSADQQIRVKNIRSQRVIKARVKSAGVVEALL
ncbi:MAG: flagellar basal body P-ring formation chaperone FlgA [Pseudomonadales bacterium]